jgi:cell division protein ZapE
MLMDLFFDNAQVTKKRRTHFHVFMAEVHRMVGEWREGDAAARKRRFGTNKGDDPIGPVADVIASQARLLCFDELQVTDIADAMILGRLFEALFERRVVLVATSNRAPDELYKNGINRQLFLPFISMIERRCQVVEIAGPRDFRLDRLKGARVWFSPLDGKAAAGFDALWRDMTSVTREVGATVEVLGRKLEFPRAAGGLVRASFAELCGRPLGPQDYLALAERFHTVFLEAVPKLNPAEREKARRLVTLIDALYEAGTKLVVLADAEPEALYPAGDGAFEFERTVSRLQEMRSASYLERART